MTDQIDPQRVIRHLANRIAELEVLCAQQAAAISHLVEQQHVGGQQQHATPPTDSAVRVGGDGGDERMRRGAEHGGDEGGFDV